MTLTKGNTVGGKRFSLQSKGISTCGLDRTPKLTEPQKVECTGLLLRADRRHYLARHQDQKDEP